MLLKIYSCELDIAVLNALISYCTFVCILVNGVAALGKLERYFNISSTCSVVKEPEFLHGNYLQCDRI